MLNRRTITHAHLFCGLGGGARGFNQGHARVGELVADFRCIGGIDVDPAAIRDFERLAGVPGTVLDLFSRDQYTAFHGHEPVGAWREAMPSDLVRAFGNERPNILFLSAPCKGFSGLLSETKAASPKYQALNELALRGILLALEAYKDDPIEIILFENVPRVSVRGAHLVDQIGQLLEAYGYAHAPTVHNCGELGRLAQSRNRFLLVARHRTKVPPFLYEPLKHPLRCVGDVLEKLALPGAGVAGPLHRIPQLHWRTWIRLAFVEAGKDWRSLERLRVVDGQLQDYALLAGADESVAGTSDTIEIANPHFAPSAKYDSQQLGVTKWSQASNTVTSQRSPGQGKFSVADPRIDGHARSVQFGVRRWDQTAGVVTTNMVAGAGPNAVADPRLNQLVGALFYRIVPIRSAAEGLTAVADPRPAMTRQRGDHYLTAGHYGVIPWKRSSHAVTGSGQHDNGFHNVADPRLPAPRDRVATVIRSLDGCWHRPFTTLELAALQGLFDAEDSFLLDGANDSAWRERIGNAVPPPAARAIASEMGRTLLLAWSGETFALGSTPIWVRPIAMSLSLRN